MTSRVVRTVRKRKTIGAQAARKPIHHPRYPYLAGTPAGPGHRNAEDEAFVYPRAKKTGCTKGDRVSAKLRPFRR